MKKSSLQKQPAAVSVADNRPFVQVFLLKRDGTISSEPGIPENKEPLLTILSEEEMNKIIIGNRAVLFGNRTVGVNAQIGDTQFLWDAFLFDFSNEADPRCYLLKVSKGLTQSMLSMIAINSYLESRGNRVQIIQTLRTHIEKDKAKLKTFKPFINEGYTLEDMLDFVIHRSLRALFVVNEDDPDSAKLYNGYAGARSENLNVMFLSKYIVGKSKMLSVFPAFADLPKEPEVKAKVVKEKVIHTEDHHLAKSSESVRSLYERLKKEAIKIDKGMLFNPNGNNYIAMKKTGGKNLAFFHFRKTAIYLVVKLDEKIVRKMVKKAEIKSLPASVQKFWNGASTGLVFSSTDHLKEIIEVLKKLIKQ